jgi:hypothetical protein
MTFGRRPEETITDVEGGNSRPSTMMDDDEKNAAVRALEKHCCSPGASPTACAHRIDASLSPRHQDELQGQQQNPHRRRQNRENRAY